MVGLQRYQPVCLLASSLAEPRLAGQLTCCHEDVGVDQCGAAVVSEELLSVEDVTAEESRRIWELAIFSRCKAAQVCVRLAPAVKSDPAGQWPASALVS